MNSLSVASGRSAQFCVVASVALAFALASPAFGQSSGPTRITLDEAIQMALQHNHNMLAARTTIQQSQAEEITANLRPNPDAVCRLGIFASGLARQAKSGIYGGQSTSDYLHNNTEGDIGLSYLIERGKKRQHRLQAQKDITAQTRSLVADNERGLTFQVASLFINVQLAESTLELAEKDLKSFQKTVDHQRAAVQGRRHQRERLPEDQAAAAAVRDRLSNRHNWPRCRRCRTCGSYWATNPLLRITMSRGRSNTNR